MKRLYLGGGERERDARRYSPAGAINTLAHATATHTVLQLYSEDVNILHMQENTQCCGYHDREGGGRTQRDQE